MDRRRLTIGGALDECITDTSEEWFREHSGLRTREEAAASDIRQVSGTIERLSGGRMRVFVGITAYKRHQSMQNFYLYQLVGNRGYVRQEHSKAAV